MGQSNARGPGADEEAVKAVVERFLNAAGNGDLDAMPAMFASKANIASVSLRNGTWVRTIHTVDEWLAALKTRTPRRPYCEPVSHFIVHIEDGQLAFVRADATIVVDGQARSRTIDYFTLIQADGAWKFVNASYVAKPTELQTQATT